MKWLELALLELGDRVKEIPGSKHEPRIVEYHSATSLQATADEVPWCSSFANWVMRESGIQGTGSAMARSWLRWGTQLLEPRFGCIVVLSRGEPPAGHVGLFIGERSGRVYVAGGNQGDAVTIARFPRASVLGFRWPAGRPPGA